ncbi:MAG: hypothetical protein OXI44_11005 [Bacteroidota bacterium]|nr:hypothetical protein [Bacteroidota bacterium]
MDFEGAIQESTLFIIVEVRDWRRHLKQPHLEIERDYVVVVGSQESRTSYIEVMQTILVDAVSVIDAKMQVHGLCFSLELLFGHCIN